MFLGRQLARQTIKQRKAIEIYKTNKIMNKYQKKNLKIWAWQFWAVCGRSTSGKMGQQTCADCKVMFGSCLFSEFNQIKWLQPRLNKKRLVGPFYWSNLDYIGPWSS